MEGMNIEINEDILINYLNGNLSIADRNVVESWYIESKDNQKILEQLYFTLFVSDRLGAMNSIDVDKSLREFKRRLRAKENISEESIVDDIEESKARKFHYSRYVAAAIFIGVLFAGGLTVDRVMKKMAAPFIVMTNLGERAQVSLPDGTKVWLNACSRVEYKSSLFSNERNVTMDGEAYFEVKKDKNAPFIVNSNGILTHVLGTKFNIRANADEQYVIATLLEGSILVTSSQLDEQGVKMKPDQQLRLDTKTGKCTLKDCSLSEDYIGWISGTLHFEQATLGEIALSLERYYNVSILFKNERIKQERFTCDFETNENIHQILSILKLTDKFDYKIDKRNILIFSKK